MMGPGFLAPPFDPPAAPRAETPPAEEEEEVVGSKQWRVFWRLALLVGDEEHLQSGLGTQQGGRGGFNSHASEATRAERSVPGAVPLLLSNMRDLSSVTAQHGGRETASFSRSRKKCDGGLSKDMWVAEFKALFPDTVVPRALAKVKDVVLAQMKGVVVMSGVLCGDAANMEKPLLKSCSTQHDAMHPRKLSKHVLEQCVARLVPGPRRKVWHKLNSDELIKPSMSALWWNPPSQRRTQTTRRRHTSPSWMVAMTSSTRRRQYEDSEQTSDDSDVDAAIVRALAEDDALPLFRANHSGGGAVDVDTSARRYSSYTSGS